MKQLNKGQWIAIGLAVVFVGYIFLSDSLINIFNMGQEQAGGASVQTGFRSADITTGSGLSAQAGDTVVTHYTGRLTNGEVFDSSVTRGTPITFTLGVGQVIRGWDEGLIGMKEGGKRMLTISPEYGYGDRQVGPIPANSTLEFEVELIKVVKPQ